MSGFRRSFTRTILATTLSAGALVVAGAAPAVADDSTTDDTVSVSGSGNVKATPDTLVTHFVVHAKRASTQAALAAAGKAASRVVAALEAEGVADADIQTTGLNVGPTYDRHGRFTGKYRASEGLTARMHPLDKAGDALDAAVAAGGNSVRISSSSLTVSDKEKYRSAARAQAFANAKAAAEQYAELAGRQLGRAMKIVGTASGPSAERVYRAPAAADSAGGGVGGAAASIPVNPGKQKVRASVHVVWALEDAPPSTS